jgi:putative hydrolase of the HAD superfamily
VRAFTAFPALSRRSAPARPRLRLSRRLLRDPAGDHAGQTVWLFDLDNTLHDASHAIFPAINRRMTAYVARVLGSDMETASRVRTDYWKRYGATLLGMIRHHGVDPAEFLREAHDFPELPDMVRVRRGLAPLLAALPGRKILLTNAPEAYARDVLRIAGIARHFERVVAIEQMWVHKHLRPKPDRRMLRRLLAELGIAPSRAVLVEDTVSHLKRYAGLGIRTAWVTGYLRSIAPARPHAAPVADAGVAGAATDAAVRAAIAAQSRQHAPQATQETAVTLVAAEAQAAPAEPPTRSSTRLRTFHRPGYVSVKVQSTHQLLRRMRGIGS